MAKSELEIPGGNPLPSWTCLAFCENSTFFDENFLGKNFTYSDWPKIPQMMKSLNYWKIEKLRKFDFLVFLASHEATLAMQSALCMVGINMWAIPNTFNGSNEVIRHHLCYIIWNVLLVPHPAFYHLLWVNFTRVALVCKHNHMSQRKICSHFILLCMSKACNNLGIFL